MILIFFDFFVGVGGFCCGLELVGMICFGYCEKDKFVWKFYEVMYDIEGEWFYDDIISIDFIWFLKVDLWIVGSFC